MTCTPKYVFRCQACDGAHCMDCYHPSTVPVEHQEWKTIGGWFCDREECRAIEARWRLHVTRVPRVLGPPCSAG